MNGRITRPDTRPHLIACPQPTEESTCINGGIHTGAVHPNIIYGIALRPDGSNRERFSRLAGFAHGSGSARQTTAGAKTEPPLTLPLDHLVGAPQYPPTA